MSEAILDTPAPAMSHRIEKSPFRGMLELHNHEQVNGCGSKPIHFRVICHAATDNGET